MHYRKVKSILSAKNGMNLYRGCTHGCIYCDSRSQCYAMTHLFEDVQVKINAPQLLQQALESKRSPCMIGTGSMCDPYLPIEETERLTRQGLELIESYGFGATVLTKSPLVLRDLDLLQSINRKTKCVVQMTMTTYDEKLCRVIEPNVAGTHRRFETLMELKKAGIPTVVWMTPILPFINDTRENILGLLDYCKQAGVRGILTFGMGVTLRKGSREYFYKKLDQHFPGMKERYIATYGDSYNCLSPNGWGLESLVRDFCRSHRVLFGEKEVFAYLNAFEEKEQCQLTLF